MNHSCIRSEMSAFGHNFSLVIRRIEAHKLFAESLEFCVVTNDETPSDPHCNCLLIGFPDTMSCEELETFLGPYLHHLQGICII